MPTLPPLNNDNSKYAYKAFMWKTKRNKINGRKQNENAS